MPATVIAGCQWGDEGKGKIVDFLSDGCDLVARFQGGSNAGHTIVINDKKYVLHLLPAGVLRGDLQNVIGNGVVVDPFALAEEVAMLEREGIDVLSRLHLSEGAHVILPTHQILDKAIEEARREDKIGTTLRGIGLTYADKARRIGIRLGDLRHRAGFEEKFHALVDQHEALLRGLFDIEPPDRRDALDRLRQVGERIAPLVVDTVTLVNGALRAGKNVLCEGAQGVMLDLDHGTYPYVTSSSPTPGGACTGLGIPPTAIRRVVGIAKAYTTRVGSGPFPTELHGEQGDRLRKAGGEFGATTGRPRRCGWLDLPVLRRAIQICGCTELVVTKLDVLDEYDEIKVCTKYRTRDGDAHVIPLDPGVLATAEPVYDTWPGWQARTAGVGSVDQLPPNAWRYVQEMEAALNTRVSLVSTGPQRDATLHLAETMF